VRKTLIALAVLAVMTAPSVEAGEVWQLAADRLQVLDLEVEAIDGRYLVSPADLKDLGIDLSKLDTVNGKVDLTSIGVVTADDANAILHIKTRADLLPVTQIDFANTQMFMKPSAPTGTFLNYDVRTNASLNNSKENSATALLDGNTYADEMRFTAQVLARSNSTPQTPAVERLSLSATMDDAQAATSFLFGDGYTSGGAGVAPVRFTGMQFRKDFSLTPGFITSPTISMSGVAAAASTVDVLIGNQLMRSQEVPAGPFSVTNLQPTVGSTAQIVVTDVFGQQQVISSRIGGNPSLLKSGVDDFALQAGAIRPTLSTNESIFTSFYYRRGLNETLTYEVNGEISAEGTTLPAVHHIGASAAMATKLGNFSAGARAGSGSTGNVGYQNAWRKNGWNALLNASLTKTSTDYLQLGGGLVSPLTESIQAIVQRDRVSVNALMSQSNGITIQNVGLVISPSNPSSITWSASAMHLSGPSNSSTSLTLNASIPLDSRNINRTHQASAGATMSGGQATTSFDYANRSNDGQGGAYRAHVEDSASATRLDGYFDHRAFEADTGIAVSTVAQQTALRAYARGALVKAGDALGFTRWIEGGYAVVDAGTPGATVQLNGTPAATTNRDGVAVVSNLQPFSKNAIRLAPESIPDNYDDLTSYISTHRRAQASVVFRGHSMVMVRMPGIAKGILEFDGETYTITERGAFLELTEGSYRATVNGKTIRFDVPKSSELVTVTGEYTTTSGVYIK